MTELQQIRLKLGWFKADAARYLNIDISTYNRYEDGKMIKIVEKVLLGTMRIIAHQHREIEELTNTKANLEDHYEATMRREKKKALKCQRCDKYAQAAPRYIKQIDKAIQSINF